MQICALRDDLNYHVLPGREALLQSKKPEPLVSYDNYFKSILNDSLCTIVVLFFVEFSVTSMKVSFINRYESHFDQWEMILISRSNSTDQCKYG